MCKISESWKCTGTHGLDIVKRFSIFVLMLKITANQKWFFVIRVFEHILLQKSYQSKHWILVIRARFCKKKNYKKNIQIENTGLIPVQISKIVAKTKWYVSHLYVFNLDVIILPQYCWNTAKNKSIVTILHIWWKLDLNPSTKIHCKRQNRLNCLWFCIQSYLEIWFLTHKPYILLV